MELELQATLERADRDQGCGQGRGDRDAESPPRRAIARGAARSGADAKAAEPAGSLNGVLSIDMVSAENKEVLASTLENRVGTKALPYRISARWCSQSSWFEKLNVLLFKDRQYYMLQDPLGSSGSDDPILRARGHLPGADSPVAQGHALSRRRRWRCSPWPARFC